MSIPFLAVHFGALALFAALSIPLFGGASSRSAALDFLVAGWILSGLLAIAAASIVAKVHRDALMRIWDKVFPEYGLASHKGYSTPEHWRALERLGPTPLHRLSFEPVRLCSRFPIDYNLQMDLFDTVGAA